MDLGAPCPPASARGGKARALGDDGYAQGRREVAAHCRPPHERVVTLGIDAEDLAVPVCGHAGRDDDRAADHPPVDAGTDLAGRGAMEAGGHGHRPQRPVHPPAGLEQRGKERPGLAGP